MAKNHAGDEMNTDAFFTRVGMIPTAEATHGEMVMGLAEHAAHMTAALGYYDTAMIDEGFIRMAANPAWMNSLASRYGDMNGAKKVVLGKVLSQQRTLMAAKSEFMAAYGLNLMTDNAESPEAATAFKNQAEEAYEIFEREYRGESQARRAKREELQAFYAPRLAGQYAVAAVTAESAPTGPERQFDPTAPISLARALRPEFVGLKIEDVADVTPTDMAGAHPNNLRSSLLNVRQRTRNNVQYRRDGAHSDTRITIGPAEWDVMLHGSPQRYAEKGLNRTEKAQRRLQQEERDTDASRRAENHFVEDIRDSMQGYRSNILEPTLALIERFQEATLYNAGLARFGNEANMLLQLDDLWEHVIGHMVWAVRVAENHPPEWEDRTMQALKKGVYFSETPAARRNGFRMLLDLAYEWKNAEKEYLQAKGQEAEQFLFRNRTEVERRTANGFLQHSA